MFDIKKALKAALSVSHDRTRRCEFAQFLLRLSDPSLPVSQWRTVGGTADIMEAFLTELGFGESDYKLYTSKLDPSVKDFRWGTTKKYEALRSCLCSSRTSDGDDNWVYRFVDAVYTGSEDPVKLIDTVSTTVAEGRQDQEQGRARLPNVAELSQRRVFEFGAAVNKMKEDMDSHPEDQELLSRYVRANDALESLSKAAFAIPDLAFIEEIVRTTGLIGDEDCPPFRVFTSRNNHESAITQQREQDRTIMRYLRNDEIVPGENILFSGLAPLDYHCTRDYKDGKNPLRGYFFRSRDTSDLIDLSDKPFLLAMGFEALTCEHEDKLKVLEFASDAKRFWTYVRNLYKAFFGPEATVALLDKSRLAACNNGSAWSMYALRTEKQGEVMQDVTTAQGLFSLSSDDTLAIFGLLVSVGGYPRPLGAPELLPESTPVEVCRRSQVVQDECDYSDLGLMTSEIAAEWYENVHRCCGPMYFTGPHRIHGSLSEQDALRKFRRRIMSRPPSKKRLREEANYDSSDLLKPELTRSGTLKNSSVSSFVTGVGLLLRSNSSSPTADGEFTLDSDLDTAFWTGRNGEAHGKDAYISAVYSGIDFPGSHFEKVMNATADTECGGVKYVLDDPDGWLDEAVDRQLDEVPKNVSYGRVIVVETNVKWTPEFATSPFFWSRLRHLCVRSFCCGDTDPRAAIRIGDRPGIYPTYNVETVERSFINGVSRRDYLSDIGASDFLYDAEAANDSVVLRTFCDSKGRIVLAVGLYGIAERTSAILFRYETGLPFVEAGVIAKLAHGDPSNLFVMNSDDSRESVATAYRYWAKVMKSNDALSNGLQWDLVRSYSYGTWFRTVDRSGLPGSPTRDEYLQYAFDPSRFISL